MIHKLTIDGRLNNLNDYIQAERQTFRVRGKFNTKGNIMKHKAQEHIIKCVRRDLKGLQISCPVFLHYHFYEPNEKRDLDNIASFAMKVTQDSLVLAKVIPNDGWRWIKGFSCDFDVDKDNPHIDVEIEESE